METEDQSSTLNEYLESFEPHLYRLSSEEQRAAIALYRELSMGRAVDAARLAHTLGGSLLEIDDLLQKGSINSFAYRDDEGRVTGFGGLAATPMHHVFEVDGRTLWTWCAWDCLRIPGILGRPARITSADPENGELVRLVVTPNGIESADPSKQSSLLSRPPIDAFRATARNVMTTFCHFVSSFFSSRSSGEPWVQKRPGTLLYLLSDAFALAMRINERNFGAELARLAH